jgi:outer membrane PBP1 activator LpoA protein
VDLQGVRYLDMPWFVHPTTRPSWSTRSRARRCRWDYERLYALGIDAFRIASSSPRATSRKLALDGVTGKITLEGHHVLAPRSRAAEIDGGRVIPLKSP